MRTVRIGLTAVAVVLLAAVTDAQQPIDVGRLPLDLQRIHKGLQQSTVREEREGLNLRYIVEVYGQAPPMVLFGPDDNLVHGPVPYSAPTHRDMIEHVTPREYRAPAADLGALARWLADRAKR
jgi:hypothetical protein